MFSRCLQETSLFSRLSAVVDESRYESDMIDAEVVLSNWRIRAARALAGHYNSARKFEARARVLTFLSLTVGLAAAILTAAILSSPDPSTPLRIAAVVAASGATLLGLVQNQLNLGPRAAHHLAAGAGYSRIRRMIEILDPEEPNVLESKDFQHVIQAWTETSQSAPIIPKGEWKAAHDRYPKALEKDPVIRRSKGQGP
jgi:hypothetical protein